MDNCNKAIDPYGLAGTCRRRTGYLCRDRPRTKKPAALDLHHLDDHQNCKSGNVNYVQSTAQITDGQARANFIGDSARPNQTMKPSTLLAYAGSNAYDGLPTKGRPCANTGKPNHRQAILNSTLFGLYGTCHIWKDYPCRDSHAQVTAQNQWRSLTLWAYTGPTDTVDYPRRDGHAQVTAQNQRQVLTPSAYTGPDAYGGLPTGGRLRAYLRTTEKLFRGIRQVTEPPIVDS